jgi:hypothetical protein
LKALTPNSLETRVILKKLIVAKKSLPPSMEPEDSFPCPEDGPSPELDDFSSSILHPVHILKLFSIYA